MIERDSAVKLPPSVWKLAACLGLAGLLTGCQNVKSLPSVSLREIKIPEARVPNSIARLWRKPRYGREVEIQSQLEVAQNAERSGRLKNAEAAYREVAKTPLTEESRDAVALAHHRLGVVYDKQGHYYRAERHYMEALKLQPGSYDVMNDLGCSYLLQGDSVAAGEVFDRAVRPVQRVAER